MVWPFASKAALVTQSGTGEVDALDELAIGGRRITSTTECRDEPGVDDQGDEVDRYDERAEAA